MYAANVKRLACVLLLLAGCAGRIDVQGHRGARGLVPENTVVGFVRAMDIGVCTLEMDVGMTADGVLVTHHDETLSPDIARAGGAWLEGTPPDVHALPFAQLQTYDVGQLRPGSAYAKRFAEQEAVPNTRIPRLVEVIREAEARTQNRMRYNIETKLDPAHPHRTPEPEAFARTLVDVVRAEGIAERTDIQSFDWRTLRAVQRIAPEIATACLTSEQSDFDTLERGQDGVSPWTAGIDADDHRTVPRLVQAAGCAVWSPSFRDIDAAEVREARGFGIRTAVWTVNEEADIEAMIDLGVDAIISDYPDRVLAVMKRKGVAKACR